MIGNSRGEMGFMEAIIAIISVVVVLCIYLTFAAVSPSSSSSPLDDFDEKAVDIGYEDGETILSDAYILAFMADNGLRGMDIILSVPLFEEQAKPFHYGKQDGTEYSRKYMVLSGYSNGRTVPVIMEAVAYA